jgi:hypothetical protein
MSYDTTDAPARRRPWPRGRILGSVIGLAVVVSTGAVAEASTHGDSFLTNGGAKRTTTPTYHATTKKTDRDDVRPTATRTTDNDWARTNWHPSTTKTPWWMVNTNWMWTGWGTNHWGFRPVVDPMDPTFNQALGINDNGTIVGYFGSGADASHPNKGWWASAPYTAGSFRDVNFPGSVQTQVVGINDDGTVVGFYVEGDDSNHGFVRWHGQYITVDFPHTTSSPAFNQLLGISPGGIAAGFWNDSAGHAHGYTFNTRTRKFTSIKLPWGVTSVTVTGVTDDGTVVGFAMIGKVTVAFEVNRHTATVIKLGDGKNTQALGVNRKGVVVGSYEDKAGKTRGFVWSKGNLKTVDAPWGAKSTVVNGLNDEGMIVGFFEDSSGNTKGFVARQ